jgi:hypothetical protein
MPEYPGQAARLVMLLKRDGPACWLCHENVDIAAPRGSKRAPSIDHVIERRNGGSNLPANLRVAHVSCNNNRDKLYPHTAGPPAPANTKGYRSPTVYDVPLDLDDAFRARLDLAATILGSPLRLRIKAKRRAVYRAQPGA